LFYSQWYNPGNALIVITGDFDSADAVEAMVRQRFGSLPSNPQQQAEKIALPDISAGARYMKRRIEFDVPILVMGYPAPPASDTAAISLEIIMQIIAFGETSRLHRSVVRKQNVAVMAGGMNHLLKYSGMSLFFTAFTPDISAKRVEAAVTGEINQVLSNGITSEEFEKVKNTTLANRIYEAYSAENVCQRLGSAEMIEGDYRHWVRRMEILESLSPEKVVETARQYWSDNQKRILVLNPRRIRPLILIMGLMRRLTSGRAQR
jgi:zinc protease